MDIKEILTDKNIEYKSRGRDYIVKCFNPEHEDSQGVSGPTPKSSGTALQEPQGNSFQAFERIPVDFSQ